MHVAVVTAFPRDRDHIDGGVAGVAKYLTDELSRHQNITLTVIEPKSHVGKTICQKWEKIEVYRMGKGGVCRFLPGTFYDIFAGRSQLRYLLRQVNPDIVHFQGLTFLAADCEQPSVLTIHGIVERDAIWDQRWGLLRWPKWLLLRLTEQYGRRRVPHVVLISNYVREFLPKTRRPRKTWLINNPVADSYFDVKWTPEPGRLFCCSRIRPLKNTLGVIKAFAAVVRRFPHAQLRIAGAAERNYLQTCKRHIEMSNLQDRVDFLGNLGVDQVQSELSRANCLAMTSFQENAPLAIEEAMAVGVPVVAAKVGGVPELVEDGITGFLIDPHDTEGIAGAVCRILSDDGIAKSMCERARRIAQERFRASAVCERTVAVYNEVLSESSSV